MNKKCSKYGQNDYLFIEPKDLKRFVNLNFFHIEARNLIKIVVKKFKERSCFGAKYDCWLSPEKESTVNSFFDSV